MERITKLKKLFTKPVDKIESLTEEQDRELGVCANEAIKVGLSLHDPAISKKYITSLVNDAYKVAGLDAPKRVLFALSPEHGLKMLQEEYKKVGIDKTLKELWTGSNIFSGTHESFWIYRLLYFKEVCGLTGIDDIMPQAKLSQVTGWSYFRKYLAIVCQRPIEMHMRNEVLHRAGGPAILYEDGMALYALNGVMFDGDMIKYVTMPTSDLNPKDVLSIKNVEQRAEVIKRYGIDKLFTDLPNKVIDSGSIRDRPYTLYQIELGDGYVPRKYLKMQNPSVKGDTPLEAVHPDCVTVQEANCWRDTGKDIKEIRNILKKGWYQFPRILT